jgi:hypothetical protein
MEEHLKFAICRLPFDLLVFRVLSRELAEYAENGQFRIAQPPAKHLTPGT